MRNALRRVRNAIGRRGALIRNRPTGRRASTAGA